MSRDQGRRAAAFALQCGFGWLGLLGIGFLFQRRFLAGFLMLAAFWPSLWMVSGLGVSLAGILLPMLVVLWLIAPPLTGIWLLVRAPSRLSVAMDA